MDISGKILKLIKNHKLRKKDVYEKLGISDDGFNKKLKNQYFTTKEIQLLSELFGVSEAYFFEGEAPKLKFRKAYKVPVKAYAGYIADGLETIQVTDLEEIVILDKDYPQDIRCFEVEGDSMYPVLDYNDVVICTKINEIQELKKGKIYLFVTDNNILVKYLGGVGATELLLKSANKNYEDLKIKKESIREIWKVLALNRDFE